MEFQVTIAAHARSITANLLTLILKGTVSYIGNRFTIHFPQLFSNVWVSDKTGVWAVPLRNWHLSVCLSFCLFMHACSLLLIHTIQVNNQQLRVLPTQGLLKWQSNGFDHLCLIPRPLFFLSTTWEYHKRIINNPMLLSN